MNGKFLIRGYAPADEAALTALWKRCFGDSEELIHGFFALLPELGAGVTAELDGKPVGMAFAICGMALSSGEKCGYIYAVAVDESCRGFGAGGLGGLELLGEVRALLRQRIDLLGQRVVVGLHLDQPGLQTGQLRLQLRIFRRELVALVGQLAQRLLMLHGGGFNIIDNVGAVKPADRRAELRKISHSLLLPFSDFFTVYHEKRRKTTENVAARAQARRFHDLFTDAGAASDDVYSSISRVPATTRVRPRAAFFVSFSWNTR